MVSTAAMGHQDPLEQLVQLGKRTQPSQDAAQPAPGTHANATGPKVYFETYGCQMNVADSNMLSGLLDGDGYRKATSLADADVIIVNTCAVREKAEERVYRRANELVAHKERNKGVVLAITGCMAEHLKEKILERAPLVDIIAGPDAYRRVPALIAEAQKGDGTSALVDTKLDKRETYEGVEPGDAGGDGVSSFLTIQRGCDKFCTFCVVPYTRGRERGVPPREVLGQARDFAAKGFKEIVLLGQTVNSYQYEDKNFSDLLRAVALVDGIERIRFTSPYPVSFTSDVIDAIATEPKICNSLHLPVQSGSTDVLERMRRGYTAEDFRKLVRDLRAAVPDIALSTDILSGFCGETEQDHEMTLALMREVRFDSAFMFTYSERELTVAAKKMPDDVQPEVKKRRLREIIALQESISREVHAAQVGKTERVLIHSQAKRSEAQLVGRTDGYKSVILPRGNFKPGDFADVTIVESTMATLFAEGARDAR
ncbi:MAG: tRNA (N6-isopentenyl adenosine(37)-C2)-methylthiotransferase MiaB [Myxococcales bacterium]|nr:tRNA (N6-isopentenyl adenosine(37)-C2)-methylthiotransferase MiaB [Myxococcales bacterium]